MKIYIASRDQERARALREVLTGHGFTVVSRWLEATNFGKPEASVVMRQAGSECINDVKQCDALVLLTEDEPGKGGHHVEAGAALGLGRRVFIVSYQENTLYYHPSVTVVPNEAELIRVLQEYAHHLDRELLELRVANPVELASACEPIKPPAAEPDTLKDSLAGASKSLFQLGDFTLHSGAKSKWKLECDALSDSDWKALAEMMAQMTGPFSSVEGISRGGLKLVEYLDRYKTEEPGQHLIVADVLTTGGSLVRARAAYLAEPDHWSTRILGAVVFARGPCPPWVKTLFQMPLSLWCVKENV
jgi:hypothetical protein